MILQVQLGQERSKRGNSLIEVTAVLAIIAVLFSIVWVNYKARVNNARLQGAVNEMMSIAQASLDFYNDHFPQGAWPLGPGDLYPKYMYAAIASSPFGGSYHINGVNDIVTVWTTVPSGLAHHYYQGTLLQILPGAVVDTISITQGIPNELTGRLAYEKKYVYKE